MNLTWKPGLLLLAALVFIDQVTKLMVVRNFTVHELVDILPFLGIYLTYNEGIAFSMFSDVGNEVLIAFVIAVSVFVVWLWRNVEAGRWISQIGYALVLGGAIGNLIDRVALGKVVDFVFFHTPVWSFAIFNLADTFVTLGAAAIILDEFLIWRRSGTVKE